MADFNSRAILVLDRIYRFVGGKTLGRLFDTETPITPVHDVSREAEIGAGFGQSLGYWNWNRFRAAAGAETYRYADDIKTQLTWYSNPDPANTWTWLLHAGFNISAATLTRCSAVLWQPAFGGVLPGTPGTPYWASLGVYFANDVGGCTDQAGTGGTFEGQTTTNIEAARQYPIPVFDGATLSLEVTVGGACSWNFSALMWTGPKGVLPPGKP